MPALQAGFNIGNNHNPLVRRIWGEILVRATLLKRFFHYAEEL